MSMRVINFRELSNSLCGGDKSCTKTLRWASSDINVLWKDNFQYLGKKTNLTQGKEIKEEPEGLDQ